MAPFHFHVHGVVRSRETGHPLPRLLVRAYDRDLVFDDHLGDAVTDRDGRFRIDFTTDDFRDFVEERPDLYLRVLDETGRIELVTTESVVRRNASGSEYYALEIPRCELARLPRRLPPDVPTEDRLIRAAKEGESWRTTGPSWR